MRDSGQPDWKCGEVAAQFELKGAYLEGPISVLSGGWQTRVKLAALLLHSPNLLLLDEPTNFLDLRTQILLEHFLRNFGKACLIVSHDRAFLGATCDHTLDLSRGKLTMYPGKIDAHRENQKERRKHDERVNAGVLAKKKHLEEFIAKNKARASTATRAKSKRNNSRNSSWSRSRPTNRPSASALRWSKRGAGRRFAVLTWRSATPSGRSPSDIRVEVEHGARTAVVGDNGQGKTTFLRTIVNSLEPLAGEVRWGHGCNIGIYAQHVYTSLPQNQTVLEYLEERRPRRHKDPGNLERRRVAALSRRRRQEEDLGALRRRAGEALPGRADAQPVQRLDPRRARQPSRRRIGRLAGRGACWPTRGPSSLPATTGIS